MTCVELKMELRCVYILVLCVGVGVMAGKYSRDMNEPKPSGGDERTVEFRIAKLNQVWEKATRVRLHNTLLLLSVKCLDCSLRLTVL